MRTPSIQKRAALGVAVLLALGIFSVTSSAQVRDPGEHALLLGVQVLARTGGELRDDVAVSLDAAVAAAAALARAQIVRDLDRLIDDVHSEVVVDEAGARVDFGVHARPEPNLRLELRWAGE
jgi:hypothetical protein